MMISNRMADCAKLLIGVSYYRKEELSDSSIGASSLAVCKRFSEDMNSLIFAVREEASKAPLEGMDVDRAFERYQSSSAWNVRKMEYASQIVSRFLYRVEVKPGILTESDARAKTTLKGLAAVSEDGTYSDVFSVPNASKIATFKKWHKDALESLVSDPISAVKTEMLSVMDDSRSVTMLAQEIKDLDRDVRMNGASPEKLERRARLEDALFQMASESEDRKGVLKEAASILFRNDSYASDTGKMIGTEHGGITEEQERAMVAEGKVLIAAGAGSGKTKVMAGKVVFHAVEQGVPLKKIIAVAFNRKAAAELRDRIISFGGSRMEPIQSMPNFKTTHSFSIRTINDVSRANGTPKLSLLKDSDLPEVLDQAIMQVAIGSYGPQLEADVNSTGALGFEPKGFFDHSKASSKTTLEIQVELFVKDAISRMIYMTKLFEDSYDQKKRDRLATMIRADEAVFTRVARWKWDESAPTEVKPYAMWDKQDKEAINAYIEGRAGGSSTARASKALDGSGLGSSYRFANEIAPVAPIGEWFNLGVSELLKTDRDEEDGSQVFEVNRESEYLEGITQFIGQQLAGLVSPEQALANAVAHNRSFSEDRYDPLEYDEEKDGDITYLALNIVQAAIYGAFQYIKGERGLMTFDDSLVLASKGLIENPEVLQSYKNKYSHILVDEAQDLNKAQHLLFGLIAGQMDPATGEAYDEDQEMNAQVLSFIGDDKQAIYEFRGARPDEFISKSDLKKGPFRTMLLNTNFRSGHQILRSANKLISYNTDQIPMVCNANPANDDGSISYTVGDIDNGSAQMEACKEISDIIEAEGFNKGSYKAGVICRTNSELAPFALGLISRGIPFYSKKPMLNALSLTGMLSLAAIKSSRKDLNTTAMIELTARSSKAFKMPFKLDKIFRQRLNTLIAQYQPASPVDWFIQTGWDLIYTGSQKHRNASDCKAYADFLFSIRSFGGNPSRLMEEIRKGTFLPLADKQDQESPEEDFDSENNAHTVGTVLQNIFDRYEDLEKALDFCSEIKAISKSSSSEQQSERRDVVFLGTAHGWKGLEADYMWMVMDKDTFPHPKALADRGPAGLAEERRLAYVAITRGRDSVSIITTREYKDENGKTRGGPSPFIREACVRSAPGTPSLPSEDITDVDVDEDTEELFKLAGKIAGLTFRLQENRLL